MADELNYALYSQMSYEQLIETFPPRELAKMAKRYLERKHKKTQKRSKKPHVMAESQEHKQSEKRDALDDDDVIINPQAIRLRAEQERLKKEQEMKLELEQEIRRKLEAQIALEKQELEAHALKEKEELQTKMQEEVTKLFEEKHGYKLIGTPHTIQGAVIPAGISHEAWVTANCKVLSTYFKYDKTKGSEWFIQKMIKLEIDPTAWEDQKYYRTRFFLKAYMYVNMHKCSIWYHYFDQVSKEMTITSNKLNSQYMAKIQKNTLSEAVNRMSFDLFQYYSGLKFYMEDLSKILIQNKHLHLLKMILLCIDVMLLALEKPDLEVIFYPGEFQIQDIVKDIRESVFPQIKNTCNALIADYESETTASQSAYHSQYKQQILYFEALITAVGFIFRHRTITDNVKRQILHKLGQTYTNAILQVNENMLLLRKNEVSQLPKQTDEELNQWAAPKASSKAKTSSHKRLESLDDSD